MSGCHNPAKRSPRFICLGSNLQQATVQVAATRRDLADLEMAWDRSYPRPSNALHRSGSPLSITS